MPETEAIEAMRALEEKKERKETDRRDTIIFVILLAAAVGCLIGFVIGYHIGTFDGYQLALKQFHIIASDLPRLLP